MDWDVAGTFDQPDGPSGHPLSAGAQRPVHHCPMPCASLPNALCITAQRLTHQWLCCVAVWLLTHWLRSLVSTQL